MPVSIDVRLRVLAIVLVIALGPSTSELVESAVHLVQHGDLAHGADHPGGESDEHGCSALFHTCGCCHTGPTAVASRSRAGSAPSAPPSLALMIDIPRVFGRGNEPPPHRPPIA